MGPLIEDDVVYYYILYKTVFLSHDFIGLILWHTDFLAHIQMRYN